MTHREHIEKAAFKLGMEWTDIDRYQEENFIASAEWADANPSSTDYIAKLITQIHDLQVRYESLQKTLIEEVLF